MTGKLPEDADRSAESDDELDNVELKSGISISIIQEILINTNQQELEASAENQKLSAYEGSGIFALNYKFSHTLNQFLFHMQDHLDTAGIDVCILSCVDPNDDTVTRLPAKFGKLSIVTPKSLRNGGNYTVIDLNLDTSGKKWQVVGIDNLSL